MLSPDDLSAGRKVVDEHGGNVECASWGVVEGRRLQKQDDADALLAAERSHAEEIEQLKRDRNKAVENWEKTHERIKAFEQAEATVWKGWRDEAEQLRAGLDNLRSLLGLSVNSGHNPDRLHGLEIAIRDLVAKVDDMCKAREETYQRKLRDERRLEGEITHLKGQLEAAKQLVKILHGSADTEDDSLCNVRRLRAELAEEKAGRAECERQYQEKVAEIGRLLDRVDVAERRAENLQRALDTNARIDRHEMKREQTVVRPWTPEEVPLGTWFKRNDGAPDRLALLGVHKDAVTLAYGYRPDLVNGDRSSTCGSARALSVKLDKLAVHWDHSTDGGKTWLPAGCVEVHAHGDNGKPAI